MTVENFLRLMTARHDPNVPMSKRLLSNAGRCLSISLRRLPPHRRAGSRLAPGNAVLRYPVSGQAGIPSATGFGTDPPVFGPPALFVQGDGLVPGGMTDGPMQGLAGQSDKCSGGRKRAGESSCCVAYLVALFEHLKVGLGVFFWGGARGTFR